MVDQVNVIRFAGMPANAAEVAHAGHITQFETHGATAVDRNGDIIDFRTPQSDKLRCDIGYYRAMWDLRGDNLRLDDSQNGQPQLYARDLDLSGEFKTIHSWHVVTSLEAEYGIPRTRYSREWTRLVRLMLRDRPKLIRGIAINNKCFLPTSSGKAITRDVQPGEEFWLHEYTGVDDARQVLDTADAILRQVTNDQHSYENLRRSFATPFLEPYKELSYILYGGGGNGKGILLNGLKRSYPDQAAIIDVDRLGRATGFSGEQAARDIIGRYWAIDPEADVIDERSMTQIKRLSTGDPMNARGIGENTVTFNPKATLLVATNNPVITAQGAASDRRMVYIRMRDGRVENGMSFDDISRFINEHGFLPFLILSATAWTMADSMTRHDVRIGSAADLEDSEAWLRDRICSDGYAIQSENPYGRLPRGCANKLGLKRSTRMVDGILSSVYVINDETRFNVYRPDESDENTADETDSEVTPPPETPLPIEDEQSLDPNEVGFPCRFTRCGDDKKAINWKQNTEDGGLDRDTALGHERTYAVVPDEGSIVLDFDINGEDGELDGWDLFSREVGNYGTEAFPRTFLVRTPSGGAHAYYRIPEAMRGRIKNAAHPKDPRFKAGLPIDTRLERKGYVVGAMSHTESGDYVPVDKPEGMVPELTEQMLAWLRDHDYVERSKPVTHDTRTIRRLASQKEAKPDMSVIPEGQRNTVLHDWALGRYINHPENRTAIHDDLMERATISGLPESEAETIWRSILDYVGE